MPSPSVLIGHRRLTVHVALLRGINVGGNNLIAMADLKGLFARAGLGDAWTLLQSGNVAFRGGTRAGAELETLLEAETSKRLKLNISYHVRTGAEWREIVARNPFRAEAKSDPAHLQTLFLKKAPDAGSVAALQAAIRGPELVHAAGRQAYILYPDGMGRSKLTPGMIDGKLGARGTSRNWNTVMKLAALVSTLEAEG